MASALQQYQSVGKSESLLHPSTPTYDSKYIGGRPTCRGHCLNVGSRLAWAAADELSCETSWWMTYLESTHQKTEEDHHQGLGAEPP